MESEETIIWNAVEKIIQRLEQEAEKHDLIGMESLIFELKDTTNKNRQRYHLIKKELARIKRRTG